MARPTTQGRRAIRRIRRLTVAAARAEVDVLLADGQVFETAPRALGLGEAEAWLGPANREFCERFQRLTILGSPWELVLGAQTLAGRGRVGLRGVLRQRRDSSRG